MSGATSRPALSTVAVIGNGIMGHGIAQVFAVAGKRVLMIGRSDASLARARGNIRTSLDDFVRHGIVSGEAADAALARISTGTALSAAATAELAIEAVTEDLPLKRRLFGELDALCAPQVVLASSSGQPPSAVTERVAHRERVIATHFWYPPQLIPLVEVCGPDCDPETLAWTCEQFRQAGKRPVVIDREIPGFIGNRLQFAMLREAWSLWASGVASAEAIDAVVRNTIGRRLGITGPLESADLGGIATMYHFARSLQPDLDRSADPPACIAALANNHGKPPDVRPGVHDWTRRDDAALLRARTGELFRWLALDRSGSEPPR